MSRLSIAALLGLCTAACTLPEPDPEPIAHDICAPITIGGDMTGVQSDALDEAIARWQILGVTGPIRSTTDDAMIDVVFEDAAQPFHGLYDGEAKIFVNLKVDPNELPIVIAHELGHAFGLDHTDKYISVMKPGNLRVVPQVADFDALVARWGTCP